MLLNYYNEIFNYIKLQQPGRIDKKININLYIIIIVIS